MSKIFLCTGGSGGHIFPAISVANTLLETNSSYDITYFTDYRGIKFFPKDNSLKIVTLRTINTELAHIPIFIWLLIRLFFFFLINRPKLLLTFGGIATVAPCIIAWLLRIPIVLHEQNAIMGKANRFIAKFARKTLTSFQDTKYATNKAITTGMPVRSVIPQVSFNTQDLNDGKLVLLVLAGSQGSDFFDNVIPDMLYELINWIYRQNPQSFNKSNITIYQQVRQPNYNRISNLYSSLGIKFQLQSFFNNIEEYYSQTNLILARSGASSVFEIIASRIPAILIPLKQSANNHQVANAKTVALTHNSIRFIEEDNLLIIRNILKDIISNPKSLIPLHNDLVKISLNNATQNILNEINEFIQ